MTNYVQHDHLSTGVDPDCAACELESLRAEVEQLRTERRTLQETCFFLAAPLCMAASGTTASAIHHITSYVQHLEAKVSSKPAKGTW